MGHVMVRRKVTKEVANPLARRAGEEERRWAAKLPAVERAGLRATTSARKDRKVVAGHACEMLASLPADDPLRPALEAKAKAGDATRRDALDLERVRERSRSRAHKHPPAWTADLPTVTETVERDGRPYKIDRIAKPGETPTRVDVGIRWKVSEPARFAPVTPELAALAQKLRTLFDVKPKVEGEFPSFDGRDFVEIERVAAIRAAHAALKDVWVTTLIDILIRAIPQRRERALNPGAPVKAWEILDPDPNKPADILDHLRDQTRQHFRELATVRPDYITEAVVAWALDRVTLGHGGGAKKSKLSADRLRKLLLDPKALAGEMGSNSGGLKARV